MKKIITSITATIFMIVVAYPQNFTILQYIQLHKDLAIREMKRMGIPASITLAQGLLETENGNSDLVRKSNNHFGIKCKSSWNAGTVSHNDDASGECFRTYKDAEASYRDHSNYLRGNDRYAFLFKLDPRDYRSWAYGLKKAGYATNPRYPDILIKNIEDNNLQQYTLQAVKDVPFYDASKYQADPEDKAIAKITGGEASNEPLQDIKTNINGLKALMAHSGRSLLAIATDNNINLTKLLAFNDLQEDGLLQKDQYIFLEKKKKEGDKDFCITAVNETLYDISQSYGVRIDNLYEYNNFHQGQLIANGQKIYLKPVNLNFITENITKPTPLSSMEKTEEKTYIVQPKDGLYSIARKYSVTVTQLKEWNKLSGDNLHIGQELIISK